MAIGTRSVKRLNVTEGTVNDPPKTEDKTCAYLGSTLARWPCTAESGHMDPGR